MLVILAAISVTVEILPLPYAFYMLLRLIICLAAVAGLIRVAEGAKIELGVDLWSACGSLQSPVADPPDAQTSLDRDQSGDDCPALGWTIAASESI